MQTGSGLTGISIWCSSSPSYIANGQYREQYIPDGTDGYGALWETASQAAPETGSDEASSSW